MTPARALSICIPTFNREHFLRETLSSVLVQARTHGVEVCVSNNHSTDGTEAYLMSLEREFGGVLTYVTQPENIGLDRNMFAAISMGSGRYIYPLGDDDALEDGALGLILKELESGPSVLILNGWHTDAKLNPKFRHLSSDLEGVEIFQLSEAFSRLWDKMPFGSFIARKSFFSDRFFNRYIGTSHAYTGSVWDAASSINETGLNCEFRCMREPTVLLRAAKKTWSQSKAKIYLYEIPTWFDLLATIPAYGRVALEKKETYQRENTSLKVLVSSRVHERQSISNIIKYRKFFSKRETVMAVLLSVIPIMLFKVMIKLRVYTKGI